MQRARAPHTARLELHSAGYRAVWLAISLVAATLQALRKPAGLLCSSTTWWNCSATLSAVSLAAPEIKDLTLPSRMFLRLLSLAFVAGIVSPLSLAAQQDSSASIGYSTSECPSCATWNAPHAPLLVHGNSYYVGTEGLGSILITSSEGHILIDGGLPESAPGILANIRALGFRIEDVKLILNSHAHYDHAGGIAALQRASGATVAASPSSAEVIERGTPGPDDPQYSIALPYPPAHDVRVIADGDTLRVGPLAIVAHFTPGHTPGGTSWSWRSCEAGRCLDLVYADSQTPVSADGYRFTGSAATAGFEQGHSVLDRLSCDLLITPHPGASDFWKRVARRDGGARDALVDSSACRRYAAAAREQLAKRLAAERMW